MKEILTDAVFLWGRQDWRLVQLFTERKSRFPLHETFFTLLFEDRTTSWHSKILYFITNKFFSVFCGSKRSCGSETAF